MDYTIFREHLEQLLKSRGITSRALSAEINVTPSTISRYMLGKRAPDLPYVVKISQFFNVSIDWLLGINGDKFEIMPAEVQEIVDEYQLASQQDRRVVRAVLDKYKDRK